MSKSSIFKQTLKEIPLESRIRIDVQSHFLEKHGGTFFMPANDTSKEYKLAMKANKKALKGSSELIKILTDSITSWKKDGCP